MLYFSRVSISRIFLDFFFPFPFLQLDYDRMQDALECIFVAWVYVYMLARRLLKGKCHSVFDVMYSIMFLWSEKSAVRAKTSTCLRHLMHRRLLCNHAFLFHNQMRPFVTVKQGKPSLYHQCLVTVSFLQTS